MNLLLTIKSLYAVNGFVAVLLYLPQIGKAWRDREHALSLSLLSFGGWCIGSLVTALYASLFVRDRMFTAVSLGNMAGSGTVFAIACYCRFKSRIGAASSGKPSPSEIPLSTTRDEADDVARFAQ